jgi:hypothetical protein
VKATASARTAASTKSGVGKASAKTAIADKKKKKAPEATPPPTTTEQVTIEVTISEPSEEEKKGESPPVIVEDSASTSVDATPLVDEAFTTPSTAEQVEQITSTETSLSEALAEKLPRLSAALTGEGEGEEGTSVDKVDSDNLEEGEAKELETEEVKEAEDERAERRKVSISVIQKPGLLLNSAQTYLMI